MVVGSGDVGVEVELVVWERDDVEPAGLNAVWAFGV
jgi:hypothetical protein